MHILYAFLILSTAFLPNAKTRKHKDFTVIQAEKQSVFPGIPGAGIQTNYSVTLIARHSFTLEADTVWAEGKLSGFEIRDGKTSIQKKTISKGDTVKLNFTMTQKTETGGSEHQEVIPGSRESNAKMSIKDAAYIRYRGGKCNCLIINNIKVLDPIVLP